MAEKNGNVIDRFTVIEGLKAYITGDLDSPENPYWDAKEEVFQGGRMADEAIQLLRADYEVMNDMMELLIKRLGDDESLEKYISYLQEHAS